MKVSELIKCLGDLEKTQGDLEVHLSNGHESTIVNVTFVAAKEQASFKYGANVLGEHLHFPDRFVIEGCSGQNK
jgi:hypothetical protein